MKKQIAFLLFFLIWQSGISQDFYFVQITDTHIGYGNHDEKTKTIIKSVNNLPFDIKFVIHTGDIFQDNIDDEEAVKYQEKIFSKLEAPFFTLPGNHDILPKDYQNHSDIYKNEIGDINSSFITDSVYFLMFYSIPLRDTSLPDHSMQKKWISNKLDKLKNEKVIICHHQPSVNDFYNNKKHTGWDKKLNFWWSNLISSYNNIDAIITGHFHRDELHWIGDTPVFVSSPVAGFWGRQASYRLYHYQNGKLSYNTIYIDE